MVKNRGNLLPACQDNLNNLRLHRFQKFAFSVKTICLHDNDIILTISFSNLSTLEVVLRVKTIILLIVFVSMQGENVKKSLPFR